MNAFVEECGALPCAAWLNGFSAGEKDPEELLSFHKSKGLKALAIIPDRNWNISDPAKKEASIQNLYAVAAAAEKLGLPITAGTELNSPGNKLVDDFSQEPLQKLMAQFLKGAEFACNL
jgi:sugar phosphate isomerase/epimerase